jgi:TetR/AcrR family transcriptional regulator, regulator of biofilm formation and stress response
MPAEPAAQPRREALVEAALRVLLRDGPRGLSHRAVAAEADLPLAATTYYFASKEELLEEALQRIAGSEATRLAGLADALAESDLRTAAGALGARALLAEHAGMLVKFEIYLEAARRPALRRPCAAWIGSFRALAEAVLRAGGVEDADREARLLVAAIDGLMVQNLATSDAPPDEATLQADLDRLVGALLAPGP